MGVLSVISGIFLGTGMMLLLAAVRAGRRPGLIHRVAPHVARVSPAAFEMATRSPNLRPRQVVSTALASRTASGYVMKLRTILARIESPDTPEVVALRMVYRGGVGLVVGLIGGLVLFLVGGDFRSIALGAGAGAIGFGWSVVHAINRRDRRVRREIAEELPVVLGFLAISVRAGETLPRALERIATQCRGRLARELAVAVGSLGLGRRLDEALRDVAVRLDLPEVTQALDVLVVAVATGTPVAQTLTVRVDEMTQRRAQRLIERASKQEVGMLIPLVFLVLPVTVAFAIFPGVVVIQTGL